MKTDDRKYLTLSGNPLHVPLWKTFHQAAGFQAGALFSTFSMAADMVINNGAYLPLVLSGILSIPTVTLGGKILESAIIDAVFDTSILSKAFKPTEKPLAIHTQPPADLRTPDSLVLKAGSTRNMSLGVLAALGLGTAFGISKIQGTAPDLLSVESLGILAQIAMPMAATLMDCAHRFNKVVKGEYAIVTAPPKNKTKEVPETSGVKQALSLG